MKGIELEIRRISDRSFMDHAITERMRQGVFRSWRCQKPGSWAYGFDITTIPGSLIITGDIGDLIVSREYDMLPWCRGSVDSTDYFASKVPHGIQTKEFSHQKCGTWMAHRLAEGDLTGEQIERLEELMKWEIEDNGPEYLYRETQEFWDGDPPNWSVWCSGFLWCRDAIRWFVMNHDEPEIKREPRPAASTIG